MSYRPICDMWLLARPKVPYYGAYPAGALGRCRDLLGVDDNAFVLHACSGMVRDYPYRGLGKNDATLDLDPLLLPDYCQDVRQPWPKLFQCGDGENEPTGLWDAVMSDPPYSEDDSTHYPFGVGNYPEPSQILKRASEVLKPGGKVGIMHYQVTRPPKDFIFIACVGIVMGFGNKIRAYSVFQKPYG